MPVGPTGWTHRMHREHKCKFVLMAWVLVSAEAGFVAWLGPKLLRHVEGSALFRPHLSLLLLGGEFGGWGVGKGGVGWCLPLAGGGGGNCRRSSPWEGEWDGGFRGMAENFPVALQSFCF